MALETAKDIMARNVKTSDENANLFEIAKKMKRFDISTVIITRKGKPIGIVTERDMAQKVAANALDVKDINAKKVMSSPLKTIKPNTNIFYAQDLMKKEHFKKLPVLKQGKLIGIVTQTDVSNYLTRKRKEFVMKSLHKQDRDNYPT